MSGVDRATFAGREYVVGELYVQKGSGYLPIGTPWIVYRLTNITFVAFGIRPENRHLFEFTPVFDIWKAHVEHARTPPFNTAEPRDWHNVKLLELCMLRTSLDHFISDEARRLGMK